jgi:acyl carrier protein
LWESAAAARKGYVMQNSRQIMDDILGMLSQLSKDWEYSGDITPDTLLFEDLGFESLDIVVLGTTIQEKYHKMMPFSEFLSDLGQREVKDLSVGELVSFVGEQLDDAIVGGKA